MNSTVCGEVHLLDDTKEYGEKKFKKRLLVLTQEDGSYTNYIPVEFIRDSCEAADGINVGDKVEVDYRLSGRRWQPEPSSEPKYFLSAEVVAYRVVVDRGDSPSPKPAATETENLPF